MNENYPHSDFIWLAIDVEGTIAAFATAGEGPIPVSVLAQSIIHISLIEKKLLQMEVKCDATMQRRYPKPDSFVALGQRGLFVFDWSDVHSVSEDEIGAYELVCCPSSPLLVTELSLELQQYLSSLSCFKTNFRSTTAFNPTTQTLCAHPD